MTAKNTVFVGSCAATISASAVLFRVREGPTFAAAAAARKILRSVLLYLFFHLEGKKKKSREGQRRPALRSRSRASVDPRLASLFTHDTAACLVSRTREDNDTVGACTRVPASYVDAEIARRSSARVGRRQEGRRKGARVYVIRRCRIAGMNGVAHTGRSGVGLFFAARALSARYRARRSLWESIINSSVKISN